MFTSVEQVKQITGYDVTLDQVNQAQAIIEAFVGRSEFDIDDASDLALLNKGTAFQAAYMVNNSEKVYEQVAIRSIAQADGGLVMDRDMSAPWIAPLAHLTLRGLSWRRSRSIHTGPTMDRSGRAYSWVRD